MAEDMVRLGSASGVAWAQGARRDTGGLRAALWNPQDGLTLAAETTNPLGATVDMVG